MTAILKRVKATPFADAARAARAAPPFVCGLAAFFCAAGFACSALALIVVGAFLGALAGAFFGVGFAALLALGLFALVCNSAADRLSLDRKAGSDDE